MKNRVKSSLVSVRNFISLSQRRLGPPPAARVDDVAPLWSGLGHGLNGAKVLVDRTHIDVPTLTLGGVLPWQIAHGRQPTLGVHRCRAYHELSFERIVRNPSVRDRPIAI